MSSGDAHTFRFFVGVACAPDAPVQLTDADARHARVLRLASGDVVELVDVDGVTWHAEFDGARGAVARTAIADAPRVRRIQLIAGALTGNRFDELVDGAVQGGADEIVPLVVARRDGERLTQRRDRLTRIAEAAAKQAKRTSICAIAAPIDMDGLLALEPGVLLDASGPDSLLEATLPDGDLRLLVGPADGLDPDLVAQLRERGWIATRLGPTILRAELAAAVAVAISSMRLAE